MTNDFPKQRLDLQDENESISQVYNTLKHAMEIIDKMKNKSEDKSKELMEKNLKNMNKSNKNHKFKITRKKFVPYRKQVSDAHCQENTEVSISHSFDEVEKIEEVQTNAIPSPYHDQNNSIINREIEIEEEESDAESENDQNDNNDHQLLDNLSDNVAHEQNLPNMMQALDQKIGYFEEQLYDLNFSNLNSDE